MANSAEIVIDADAVSKERYSAMARHVLRAVRSYFEDPKVQQEYDEWLKHQDEETLAWISS